MVEERFAKMEKLGEKWDDAPVRYFLIVLVPLQFMPWGYRMICSCGS